MVALGFDSVQALRTITALTNYVNGFVLQEQSAQQPPANRRATPESIAELLSEGNAAALLVAFAEGGSPYSEESFEYGTYRIGYEQWETDEETPYEAWKRNLVAFPLKESSPIK
jgi:hypothetical protein